MSDIIYALASAPGKAGIAVYRLSGVGSHALVKQLTGKQLLQTRHLQYALVKDPRTEDVFDEGMVAVFDAGASYTGEECAELYLHGGNAILRKTYDVLGSFAGCRLAEPGEFTRRRLHNGKTTLLQAEALSLMLEADSEFQYEHAFAQYHGEEMAWYKDISDSLLDVRADAEALLDFADEDLPEDVSSNLYAKIQHLMDTVEAVLSRTVRSDVLQQGLPVVLIGRPNVGKSTIFNALIGKDKAIVSPVPGTTRDALEAIITIGSHTVKLVDTAGLRLTDDDIEKLGVARTHDHIRHAALLVNVFTAEDESILEDILPGSHNTAVVNVCNKSDVYGYAKTAGIINITAKSDTEIALLRDAIQSGLSDILPLDTICLNKRHITILESSLRELQQAQAALMLDITAFHITQADKVFGRLLGERDSEAVLGIIFNQFCIGK